MWLEMSGRLMNRVQLLEIRSDARFQDGKTENAVEKQLEAHGLSTGAGEKS